MKERLDVMMTARGLAESREKAKALIMAGVVFVDGQREDKAGQNFPPEVTIEVRGNRLPYVSRGGLKLEKAMKEFPLSLTGKICMDVGASTGGFTDCMLQNGALKVYAVDVGHGQLDWKLRNDTRVVCLEKTNIRYATRQEVPEEIAFSSIDVSFISLEKVLPAVRALLSAEGEVVALIKPQFEAGERAGRQARRSAGAENPCRGHRESARLCGGFGLCAARLEFFADTRAGRQYRVSDLASHRGGKRGSSRSDAGVRARCGSRGT